MMSTITAVEPQKRAKNRVNIYVDGAFFIGVDMEVAVRHGLKTGMVCEAEQLLDIVRQEELHSAWNSALNRITRRMKSRKELSGALAQRGYHPEVVEQTMEKLERYGYVDDMLYARLLAKEYAARGNKGERALRQIFLRRGIAPDTIEQALREAYPADAQYEAAIQCARRTLARCRDKAPEKQKAALYRGLISRGFDNEMAVSVMRVVLEGDEATDV